MLCRSWTAARKGPSLNSYPVMGLINTDHGVVVDMVATRSIQLAEVGSTKTMLNRVKTKFVLHIERLIAPLVTFAAQKRCRAADTAYGTGPLLSGLVGRKSATHIPDFDKSGRSDGTRPRVRHCRSDQWHDKAHPRVRFRTRSRHRPRRARLETVPPHRLRSCLDSPRVDCP